MPTDMPLPSGSGEVFRSEQMGARPPTVQSTGVRG